MTTPPPETLSYSDAAFTREQLDLVIEELWVSIDAAEDVGWPTGPLRAWAWRYYLDEIDTMRAFLATGPTDPVEVADARLTITEARTARQDLITDPLRPDRA